MTDNNIPKGAKHLHQGLYYKKGEHDFLYFYDEPARQWVRSSKEYSEVVLMDIEGVAV